MFRRFTPGDGICQMCGTNCLICDYDTNLNRPKCQVCKNNGYFLPFDGLDCIENTIKNCQIQFQQELQFLDQNDQESYNIKTTLGYEKLQQTSQSILGQIIANNCALCDPGFINGDANCEQNDTLKLDDQVLIKHNCDGLCLGIIGYTIDNIAIIDIKTSNSYHKLLLIENIYKCLQCSQGFYQNILNGQCIQCHQSLNSKTCEQQNQNYKDGWKMKIRAYSIHQFESDLISSNMQTDYEFLCLTCLEGFMLFNDGCILNCPQNCKGCTIIDGQNVCAFCGSNNYGKLLTIVNNQCTNCPNNCELCQPRSSSDVQAINILFNPDDQSQYFYSYICLKPKIDSGIFYHQYLQQFIKCYDGTFCKGQNHINVYENYKITKSSLRRIIQLL